ncbi:uncharacterized protein TEOVI_000511200 [Trypanosoma equiperdum]|uniref:Uncharacterized protein n=4 Tax=Trypanozoon TaxID=39700 RepID=Q388V3_TRYB2|nr:hypothetical protein, conserved [Trypanosoma brucei gambiense DAL972]XP_827779.1 hypothetical protein, conserved [Trypanosoma brucei brucei TREU927]RHW69473.1 hypothetical protein DPX39_100135500 [Trypanosoma brucei equiperdum]SCU64238.1 hypothetical protein, conserved [Trypanosoma equiperdum]EAN78667.1 hypothetical protein, conserved [Trypanosoma brucei brucei TREU927]CBH16461.1 hypothetical protein, conserved [Trypanosoma brucei gambiense DAL972]|eukprot:XP_011778725.1 hypothetical protein, conserved [Trypanosoma brucei gambiense DAL972]
MDQFTKPLEGIFRDGIPAPVLRAFAPLYQALPSLQDAVSASRDCYYWRANPLKCVEEDVQTVTSFMQASEASFRLCPQQSATLLKCHMTEPARALFFCRDEEWEWRTCLMDQTGIRFWPYANAPIGAPWSNGGQTEDFHLEDRFFYENFSWWRRKAAMLAVRRRELEVQTQRKHWLDEQCQKDTEGKLSLVPPKPTLAPVGISTNVN